MTTFPSNLLHQPNGNIYMYHCLSTTSDVVEERSWATEDYDTIYLSLLYAVLLLVNEEQMLVLTFSRCHRPICCHVSVTAIQKCYTNCGLTYEAFRRFKHHFKFQIKKSNCWFFLASGKNSLLSLNSPLLYFSSQQNQEMFRKCYRIRNINCLWWCFKCNLCLSNITSNVPLLKYSYI